MMRLEDTLVEDTRHTLESALGGLSRHVTFGTSSVVNLEGDNDVELEANVSHENDHECEDESATEDQDEDNEYYEYLFDEARGGGASRTDTEEDISGFS